MAKSESIIEITKAIIAVMKEVKGIDKSMTVGTGNNAYKGVSDKDVKNEIGKAMEKHGLAIVPINVTPTLRIDRWEENGQYGNKQKQQAFSEVITKYLLLHDSGEWIELSGYGHGTDTQDKAAGKATTYALKYTLLYTFMVPTGKIDDAETTHSQEITTPAPVRKQPPPVKVPLEPNTDKWEEAIKWLKTKPSNTIEELKKGCILTPENENKLKEAIKPDERKPKEANTPVVA
jgi:hypothetical protein